jgi:hypothetical protein
MKKFLAYFVTIIFVGILSFSFMSFTDDDPKKAKSDTTATATVTTAEPATKCEEHNGTKASEDKKSCCDKAGKTESGKCANAKTCEHHKDSENK